MRSPSIYLTPWYIYGFLSFKFVFSKTPPVTFIFACTPGGIYFYEVLSFARQGGASLLPAVYLLLSLALANSAFSDIVRLVAEAPRDMKSPKRERCTPFKKVLY
jgi:hypothetical protein